MSILLSNDCPVNGWGYICSEHVEDSILVTFWVKDGQHEALKRVFPTSENLYKQMQIFVKSPLADYSDRHRAKAFMGREFIQYYEQNKVTKRRIVH